MTGWDSRADIGLRAPRGINTNINPTHGTAFHYAGGGTHRRASHDDCRALWRAYQDWHMAPGNANNYLDIAYNLGVCWHGIILEGRSTRDRARVRGGANGNATVNGNRYSVCAIWGSGDGAPPDSLLRANLAARAFLRSEGDAGSAISGHRDLSSTSCPGDPLYAWISGGAPPPGGTNPDPPQEESMSWSPSDPAEDRVNSNSTVSYRRQWGRTHEYTFNTSRSAWVDRIARAVALMTNSVSGQTLSLHIRRGDLSLARLTSRVSGNKISAATAILNAQEKATQARNEGRETRAMVAELADKLDSLVPGIASSVREIARAEAAKVNAADVASELEVVVSAEDHDGEDHDVQVLLEKAAADAAADAELVEAELAEDTDA